MKVAYTFSSQLRVDDVKEILDELPEASQQDVPILISSETKIYCLQVEYASHDKKENTTCPNLLF